MDRTSEIAKELEWLDDTENPLSDAARRCVETKIIADVPYLLAEVERLGAKMEPAGPEEEA